MAALDEVYMAVGGADGGIRIVSLDKWEIVKVVKSTKSLSWMFPVKSNWKMRSRLVICTAEGNLFGCNAETEGIAFKFLMNKKGKILNTSNEG